MEIDLYFTPIEKFNFYKGSIGSISSIYTKTFPDWESADVVVFSANENRDNLSSDSENVDHQKIREFFYNYKLSHNIKVADLGILNGSTPAFMAHSNSSSTQTVSNGVWTEVTINDQEEFDTDNFFNTSTGRFSPTVAGKYFFTAQIFAANGIGTGLSSILITKNGGVTLDSKDELGYLERIAIGDTRLQVNGMLSLNGTSDYVSVFMFSNAGNIGIGGGSGKSLGLFGGYRIGT